MSQGPSIAKLESWASWEAFCLECLQHALEALLNCEALPESENALNARLHGFLRIAATKIRPDGPYDRISYECPPQSYGEPEDESTRRLKPTPDFVWGFVDHRDPDPHRNARELAIECKRLRAASRSWSYNESYVADGIQRFLDEEKKYGIGVRSGVMVGYWQSMDSKDILQEINVAATAHGVPEIQLSGEGWQAAAISRLDHKFSRAFPDSPFQLRHLWPDLRGKCKGGPLPRSSHMPTAERQSKLRR